MKGSGWSLGWLVVGVAVVVLGGCKTPCEKFAAKSIECGGEGSEEDLAKACEASKGEEPVKTYVSCAEKKEDCDGFKECMGEIDNELRRQAALEKIKIEVAGVKKAMNGGAVDAAVRSCEGLLKREFAGDDPEVVELCKDATKKGITKHAGMVDKDIKAKQFTGARAKCKLAFQTKSYQGKEELDKLCKSIDPAAVKHELSELKKDLAADKYGVAASSCKVKLNKPPFKASKEIQKLCKDVNTIGVEKLTKKVIKLRDEGGNVFSACYNLKEVAEKVGPEADKKAKTLCDEAKVAVDAKKAIEEANKNLAEKKDELPYACASAAEKLKEFTSEWAKNKYEEVVKSCFLRLGVFILEKHKKKRWCKSDVRKIVQAYKKLDLKSGTLARYVANAKKRSKCKD